MISQDTKQAIVDGKLWEHIATIAQNHPKMLEAFVTFKHLTEYLEDGTPIFKKKAIFFISDQCQHRPEVIRHRQRILDIKTFPSKKVLIILPKKSDRLHDISIICRSLIAYLNKYMDTLQISFLSKPLGLIPVEISDVYPLSQHISTEDIPINNKDLANHVSQFIKQNSYREVIIVGKTSIHNYLYRNLKKFINTSLITNKKDSSYFIKNKIKYTPKK